MEKQTASVWKQAMLVKRLQGEGEVIEISSQGHGKQVKEELKNKGKTVDVEKMVLYIIVPLKAKEKSCN